MSLAVSNASFIGSVLSPCLFRRQLVDEGVVQWNGHPGAESEEILDAPDAWKIAADTPS